MQAHNTEKTWLSKSSKYCRFLYSMMNRQIFFGLIQFWVLVTFGVLRAENSSKFLEGSAVLLTVRALFLSEEAPRKLIKSRVPIVALDSGQFLSSVVTRGFGNKNSRPPWFILEIRWKQLEFPGELNSLPFWQIILGHFYFAHVIFWRNIRVFATLKANNLIDYDFTDWWVVVILAIVWPFCWEAFRVFSSSINFIWEPFFQMKEVCCHLRGWFAWMEVFRILSQTQLKSSSLFIFCKGFLKGRASAPVQISTLSCLFQGER